MHDQILRLSPNPKRIFQGDSVSRMPFVAALSSLKIILRQTQLVCQISKNTPKISYLLHMDDLKLYRKSTAELKSLLNTVRLFSNGMSMKLGLDKCATLVSTKGKVTETESSNLPNNNIKGLNLDETYKYI